MKITLNTRDGVGGRLGVDIPQGGITTQDFQVANLLFKQAMSLALKNVNKPLKEIPSNS